MRDFQLPGRSTAQGRDMMVSTSHPLSTVAALSTLQQGGNAVDAAISAAVLMGLTEPAMTGLGGDAFALIWKPGEDAPIGINGSGRAPAALTAQALRDKGLAKMDGGSVDSVTVPGAVACFDRMRADHGTMDWATLLAPSIDAAENGHVVTPRVAADWVANEARLQGHGRKHFLLPGETIPKVGDLFKYPGQARVLRAIAEHGRDGFYTGPVAEDMVAGLRELGGMHTMEDFAATSADYVTPISGDYRGTTLWELPPNTHGATAILIAKILEKFDLASLDPNGPERTHLEAEAVRLAYDARNRLIADADEPGNEGRISLMLSDDLATTLAARIDPAAFRPDLLDGIEAHYPRPAPTEGGEKQLDTVYLCVVDRDGLVVSLIYSVFHAFGSGLASPEFGIGYQNRGAGFVLEPGHPNELRGGKRPMHTIIPAMLSKGSTCLGPLGVMGGPYQPTGHVRVLTNIVDYGMDPQEAMDAPRSFFDDGQLQIERGYPRATLDRLGAMGHDAVVSERPIGGGQIILIDPERGTLSAGADPRKDSVAIGV